jgi:hypothetical protein
MTPAWLQAYLVSAVAENLCTQTHCTTCGATEFRQRLLAGSAGSISEHGQRRFDRETVIEIALALAGVEPDANARIEPAVRCILFDLWSGIPSLDAEIEELLVDSWAGGVLHKMKEHHEARQAARRALEAYQSPASVQNRREEKKRLKQEQHARRLEQKQERDRIWHQNQAKAER